MTTTTETAPTTAPTTTERGLSLPCPLCGEESATITLNLADGETFTCCECENEFTAADLRERMAKWAKVLTWVEAMPTAA